MRNQTRKHHFGAHGYATRKIRDGREIRDNTPGGEAMTSSTETGNVTGTRDKDYNLIWYTEACLNNALRLDQYIQDAERDGDQEVADLFRKAQSDSRKGAEQGK